MRIGLALVVVLGGAVAPAAAGAATLGVKNGVLQYKGGPGEPNEVGIQRASDGSYELYDNSAGDGSTKVTFGSGCSAGGESEMRCDGAGVSAVQVTLRDRDDHLEVSGLPVALTYSGGRGRDSFDYYFERAEQAVKISNDGVANDGPRAADNIGPDVEQLTGTRKADTLASGASGATLIPLNGKDTVVGGSGNDRVEAAFVEDVGLDSGGFFPFGKDTVGCGGGRDFVLADKQDLVASDCEAVGRPQGEGFKFVGSAGPDFMVVPYGWEPARIYGRGGADRIQTPVAGRSLVEGGAGDDRLRSGVVAFDTMRGGSGNDVIFVRDKDPSSVNGDKVDCGSGSDTVYADGKDKVASDCEKVRRRG